MKSGFNICLFLDMTPKAWPIKEKNELIGLEQNLKLVLQKTSLMKRQATERKIFANHISD